MRSRYNISLSRKKFNVRRRKKLSHKDVGYPEQGKKMEKKRKIRLNKSENVLKKRENAAVLLKCAK